MAKLSTEELLNAFKELTLIELSRADVVSRSGTCAGAFFMPRWEMVHIASAMWEPIHKE